MQELFWFFLGGFVYLMIDRAITFYKKVKYLNDIKYLSFKLIGYAYTQWAAITAAKYIYLEMNEHDAEEIKIMKNTEINGWNTVMSTLENHYRGVLEGDYIVNKEGNLHAED